MSEAIRISFDATQVVEVKGRATQGRQFADRVSLALALDLIRRYECREWYWPILDAMDGLEGFARPARIGGEEQFKYAPLHPLWKVHYFTPQHVLYNIGANWLIDKGGNKKLDALINNCPSNQIAHRFVIQGFQDRAEHGLTGDWLIYAKHDGKNYYLGVATHLE
ncbi:MAG: hypothetical protein ACREMY_27785, partial [bacterium]